MWIHYVGDCVPKYPPNGGASVRRSGLIGGVGEGVEAVGSHRRLVALDCDGGRRGAQSPEATTEAA